MAVLLVLVAAVFVSAAVSAPLAVQFFLSVGAVVPLAGFIGSATEHLAERTGGPVGGLLNATFGNAPDLLVGIFGVHRGLIPLVKATLVGALISNSALIMGICYLAAGIKYRTPEFRRGEAGNHSVLMLLTVGAILFPSLGSVVMCGSGSCRAPAQSAVLLHASVGVAVVLVLAYAAYIAFAIFGWRGLGRESSQERAAETTIGQVLAQTQKEGVPWPLWFSVAVLLAATVLLVPVTSILTGSVAPVTAALGWSQVFVGLVIVANAGNVAEGYAAVRLALQKPGLFAQLRRGERDTGLDLALNIASASSVQIATFVAPVVVLYSLLSHPMNLVFSPVEIGVLGLMALVFAHVVHDGKTHWLEGAQLLALYAMAAVVFFSLPASVFGG